MTDLSNTNGTLYVSTTFASDNTPVSEVLKSCEENEIYYVELGSNHCYEPNPEAIVRKFSGKTIVHNYFPIPEDPFVVNIASLNDRIHQRSVEHIESSIKFASEVGATLYTFHPGFLMDPGNRKSDIGSYDFDFSPEKVSSSRYEQAYSRMLSAIDRAVNLAHRCKIRIAIETEGSFLKREHLLMQKPEEYIRLFDSFGPLDLGINLNIGHLNLASIAFDFSKDSFVDLISDYIVAMELSHNEGEKDDHLPILKGEWYWSVINDPRFAETLKILEFRATCLPKVLESIELFNDQYTA